MIEVKPKATYKKPLPKCQCCKERFTPYNNNGLQKFCIKKDECIKAYAEWMKTEAGKKARKTVRKKNDRETRQSIKTLSEWKADLQKEINTIVRLIDKGHSCIATRTTQGKMNAGHYIGVGANDTIRFHLENIWLQSEHSNSYKSGDTIRYQEGITRLYGSEYLERLNSLKSIQPIKLNIDDIKVALKECRIIVRELKESNREYAIKQRVLIRQELNKRIGIYQV